SHGAEVGSVNVSGEATELMSVECVKSFKANLEIGSLSGKICSLHQTNILVVSGETAHVQRLRPIAVGERCRIAEGRWVEVELSAGTRRGGDTVIQNLRHTRNDVRKIDVIKNRQRIILENAQRRSASITEYAVELPALQKTADNSLRITCKPFPWSK